MIARISNRKKVEQMQNKQVQTEVSTQDQLLVPRRLTLGIMYLEVR